MRGFIDLCSCQIKSILRQMLKLNKLLINFRIKSSAIRIINNDQCILHAKGFWGFGVLGFWGLMSVDLGALTERSVHPASPVLLPKMAH